MKTMQFGRQEIVSAFMRGIGSIGQLWPEQIKPELLKNPWEAVGDAFKATGDNLRWAMGELDKEIAGNP